MDVRFTNSNPSLFFVHVVSGVLRKSVFFRLKRTSPTAYCDCREKCKCRSLIMGNQAARFDLLCRLLTDTNLVKHTNSRGENILLFLVQTVGRQLHEQRQYRPSRTRSAPRKPPVSDIGECIFRSLPFVMCEISLQMLGWLGRYGLRGTELFVVWLCLSRN